MGFKMELKRSNPISPLNTIKKSLYNICRFFLWISLTSQLHITDVYLHQISIKSVNFIYLSRDETYARAFT